jgi:ferric-dicitrate binding protein FerR (iron transport regulator)
MTNDPLYQRIRELAWRRKLDPSEEAQLRGWLAAHPEAREDWDAEAGLNEALGRLPDTAVPSNFTARVAQSVVRDVSPGNRAVDLTGWVFRYWKRLLPTAACAALLLIGGWFSVRHFRQNQPEELLQGLAALPAPEIMTNFDIICALDRTPPPDEELLKLLQ